MTTALELGMTSPDYPPRLLHLASPPHRLYCQGHLAPLNNLPLVALVGTRNATAYGLSIARQLGRFLAQHGIAVVSGLARGVDGAAHRGTLEVRDGMPVAVVGCGLDQAYPREHHRLQQQIAERGLVISEYPPGSPPLAFHFPQRNRIMAALCHILVVVEAPLRSGALISVGQALELGREVLVVPGPLQSPASLGNLRLLRDGATPLSEFSDILEALALLPDPSWSRKTGGDTSTPASAASAVDQLARLLPPSGATLEELCRSLEAGPAQLLPRLLQLELTGQAHRQGHRFYPAAPP